MEESESHDSPTGRLYRLEHTKVHLLFLCIDREICIGVLCQPEESSLCTLRREI